MLHAEAVIELAGRVPVEDVEIDTTPAAFDGNRRVPRHQPAADALAARGLRDVEVFQIEPRPPEPGRKPRMEQGASRRLLVEKGEGRLEFGRRAEAVAPQIRLGRDGGTGGSCGHRAR